MFRPTIRARITVLAAVALMPLPAHAQGVSGDVIKIGVMNDQSGP